MTEQLSAALKAAAAGLPVFRCVPGRKVPANKGWQNEATTDPDVIAELWQDHPYNIGFSTRGFVVLDVDVKNGRDGATELQQLLDLFGDLPGTVTTETPSGGKHIYFRQPGDERFGGSSPFDGIDIRADGGYVLAPGSIIAGKPYRWITETDTIPTIPGWIAKRLKAPRPKEQRDDNITALPASPGQMQRAALFLESEATPAIEGERGNETTYKVAAALRDMIGPEYQALDLMIDHYNSRCVPEWTYDELRTIVGNAYRYAANAAPGSQNPENDFKPTEGSLAPQFVRPNTVSPQVRRWQIKNVSMPGVVHILTAPPGAGKTTLGLQIAVASATGNGNLIDREVIRPARTWLYNAEDPRDELHLRLKAIQQHWQIPDSALLDATGNPKIAINSGLTGRTLKLMQRKTDTGKLTQADADRMIRMIRKHRIGLVILDPFVDLHDAEENDNVEMSRVMTEIQRIAVEADTAVILVHHSRKVIDRESASGNMEVTRGAQSIVGKARAVSTLFQMGERQTRNFRDGSDMLEPGDEVRYVAWADAKGNMSLAGSTSWFRRTSVEVRAELPAEAVDSAYRTPPSMEDTEGRRFEWEAVGVLEPRQLTRLVDAPAGGGKVDAGVIAGDLAHVMLTADPAGPVDSLTLKAAIEACLMVEDSADGGREGCAARWTSFAHGGEFVKFISRTIERIEKACGTSITERPVPVPGSGKFVMVFRKPGWPYKVQLMVDENDVPQSVEGV